MSYMDGLSDKEALSQLKKYGPNLFQLEKKSIFLQFLKKFTNPLVLVLLFASIISFFAGDAVSVFIIITIVFFSIILDFVQQYQAENSAEKLKKQVNIRSSVYRNGVKKEISFEEIVPGDVVFLSAGDLIPADGIVIESKDFFINQALLTGESFPVEKLPKNQSEKLILNQVDSISKVFMGSSVVSGYAKVIITDTGKLTELGKIAFSISKQHSPTAFDKGIEAFGLLIIKLTFFLVIFVLLVNAFFNRPILNSFLFSMALAVGLTPELLPMIMTVTLSRGAQKMSRLKVIVKKLSSIHNLGSMNILCTDKTGTLTQAKIHLEQHVDGFGQCSDAVLKLAYINSYFETGLKSPMDVAILEHNEVKEEVDSVENKNCWIKVDEVPFDFERRRISVLVKNNQEKILIVKGAPEEILSRSNYYWKAKSFLEVSDESLNKSAESSKLFDCRNGEMKSFRDSKLKEQFLVTLYNLERNGYRVLGVACKNVNQDVVHADLDDESNLVFIGFAAFLDPAKSSAKSALQLLIRKGIEIKILTGDSSRVTQHLCGDLDFTVKGILEGHEIEKISDESLLNKVEEINLFCRVNPSQKNRIITALKQRGNTVGYLGDGVNDAPSLHNADVGISVAGAVDVAKNAADIILLEHDLEVLISGVVEGRKTFGNIMKYILMGTSSNFGNMISMAGATIFLPFLPMLPTQILLNNFLYDISEIPIPTDHVDKDTLKTPRSWDMKMIQKFMIIIGIVSSIFDFTIFYILIRYFQADEKLFHTGWFVESICTQVLVIFIIRTKWRPWRSQPSLFLVLTSLGVVLLACCVPWMSIGALLGFTPLPGRFYLVLILMTVGYLAVVEFVKSWFYRRIHYKLSESDKY